MKDILDTLEQRSQNNWFTRINSLEFYQDTLQFYNKFNHIQQPTIFIAESNTDLFLSAFLAAIASKSSIFLCNPYWKKHEWEQVYRLVNPDIIVGLPYPEAINTELKSNLHNSIMISTGGTSGQIKFAIHTWETLEASVRGFQKYYDVDRINSYCILPIYHVSGLMQFIRSWVTEGQFVLDLYSQLKKGILPEINPEEYFISLVPTQLQFLLNNYPEWLRRFHTVLLGGAPAWTTLLEQARQEKINLALTYGMTETASQIVALKPQDFLQGNNSNGQVLPHSKVKIVPDNSKEGTIIIETESLYKGYYPDLDNPKRLITDDLGYFDNKNNLWILGRDSQKIITGGENVFPKEIENAILATQWVEDVAVIGIPDSQWGQVIVALYVLRKDLSPNDADIIEKLIKIKLDENISRYKHPKHWLEVATLPRNLQGKIDQAQLQSLVNCYLEQNR